MTIDFEQKASQKVSQDSSSQSLSEEQFSQVLSAIIDGKYSWACALLLRFTGHDPRNYLPYRTYIRLIKERCQRSEASSNLKGSPSKTLSGSSGMKKRQRKIVDLNHMETLDDISSKVVGGYQYFEDWGNVAGEENSVAEVMMSIPAFS
ncbi:MAG: HetP family heterocyst commitment protein [Leptolyngbyaceae cyanobacterium]